MDSIRRCIKRCFSLLDYVAETESLNAVGLPDVGTSRGEWQDQHTRLNVWAADLTDFVVKRSNEMQVARITRGSLHQNLKHLESILLEALTSTGSHHPIPDLRHDDSSDDSGEDDEQQDLVVCLSTVRASIDVLNRTLKLETAWQQYQHSQNDKLDARQVGQEASALTDSGTLLSRSFSGLRGSSTNVQQGNLKPPARDEKQSLKLSPRDRSVPSSTALQYATMGLGVIHGLSAYAESHRGRQSPKFDQALSTSHGASGVFISGADDPSASKSYQTSSDSILQNPTLPQTWAKDEDFPDNISNTRSSPKDFFRRSNYTNAHGEDLLYAMATGSDWDASMLLARLRTGFSWEELAEEARLMEQSPHVQTTENPASLRRPNYTNAHGEDLLYALATGSDGDASMLLAMLRLGSSWEELAGEARRTGQSPHVQNTDNPASLTWDEDFEKGEELSNEPAHRLP